MKVQILVPNWMLFGSAISLKVMFGYREVLYP